MQNCVIGLSNVVIQSHINTFGAAAMAACGAYQKIEGFCLIPVMSLALALATFVGQKQRGVVGGIVATLGIVFPSLLIITVLAGVINSFSHLDWVQHAFSGIRACVCVLIFNATLKLLKGSVKDWPAALIFAAVLAASLLTDLSPVIFVAAAALCGIVIQNLIRRAK